MAPVMKSLTAEPQGTLGIVLDHCGRIVQKTLGLILPTLFTGGSQVLGLVQAYWQAELHSESGYSAQGCQQARSLQGWGGEGCSDTLGTGCPEACVGLLVGPRARSSLLWAALSAGRTVVLSLGVCSLVAEAGLVARAGFLGAGQGFPAGDGTGSWPIPGQGCF